MQTTRERLTLPVPPSPTKTSLKVGMPLVVACSAIVTYDGFVVKFCFGGVDGAIEQELAAKLARRSLLRSLQKIWLTWYVSLGKYLWWRGGFA